MYLMYSCHIYKANFFGARNLGSEKLEGSGDNPVLYGGNGRENGNEYIFGVTGVILGL